jgi:SAM-dependent methyltransferase
LQEIECWESAQELANSYTYDYWNDIEEEKKKEWYVQSDEDTRVAEYLHSSGLLEEFGIAAKALGADGMEGTVLDVAAGVCWTSALLSKYNFKQIEALDFSKHRLEIAPQVCRIMDADLNKIRRIFGSFYNIKRDDAYYDLIFVSQAFHHADNPIRLLAEMDRALRKGGKICLIGEHLISTFQTFKSMTRFALKNKKISFNSHELFARDDLLGDHYYKLDDYYFMFQSCGYKVNHFESNIRNSMVLIAQKQ